VASRIMVEILVGEISYIKAVGDPLGSNLVVRCSFEEVVVGLGYNCFEYFAFHLRSVLKSILKFHS